MKYMTDDKVELDYCDQGQGQPVILVEGFGGYQEIWKLQVKYLLEMNCRVITYDHRNHGRSQRTAANLSIEQLTADLAGLIDYLKLDQPILIGHSMGASVCYDYLSHYQNVDAVMAIDQSPKMLNDVDWPYGFESITNADFSEKLNYPDEVHETLHGLDRRITLALNRVRSQYPFDRNQNMTLLFDHAQKDWRRILLKSSIPVTLVTARQSPYFDYHFADSLVDQNSLIKQVVVDNCGHDIMAEVPELFNQTLRHFIFSSTKKR
ncbi:alpha/beta fold hydrolase [Companilactobacillus crustorum]|uniref:alpha/beta fold hydrolase n=1 Tax=Companilactobacillus crustorum TaxID=392416 RepID=UPI0009579966|nr:alpha/beta hydrolase [Companilactobacillus crustorum]APU71815.1 hypothetical protein BI355_1510 [Companilactobacillus crustorum]